MKRQITSEETDRKLRAFLSLNQVEFSYILSEFSTHVETKLNLYTLKGKKRKYRSYQEMPNSSLYGNEKKLSFLLSYLKENPNQSYHGNMFDMAQSKVSEWVSFLIPVLENTLTKLGYMPQTNQCNFQDIETDCILIDVTERQVPRSVDYDTQKACYSGKLHTVKNMAITDSRGYVLYLSESYQGSVHDKKIWDETEIGKTSYNILVDLGFLGVDKVHSNVIIPHKKPKGKELTSSQKATNKGIAKVRVTVEHAFSGIKRLKIIRNKIRLRTSDSKDKVMKIATAIHNLRVTFRYP